MIKKNYLRIPMLAATMIAGITTVSAQQLAFPEAAGWGRYAKGACFFLSHRLSRHQPQ